MSDQWSYQKRGQMRWWEWVIVAVIVTVLGLWGMFLYDFFGEVITG